MQYSRILVVGLLVGATLASPALAKPTGGRVEVQRYELGGEGGASTLGPLVASVVFPTGPERFAEFEIEDSSGSSVLAEIVQDDEVDRFCSSTDEAIPIRPGFPVEVRLFAGRCLDGSPSIVTEGTVTANFFAANPSLARAASMQRPYSATAPGSYVGFDPPLPGNAIIGAVTFPGGPRRHVKLQIQDETGGTVASVVYQRDRQIGRFCGETSQPLRVGRWMPFTVELQVGVCTNGDLSAPTNGVIEATFVNGK